MEGSSRLESASEAGESTEILSNALALALAQDAPARIEEIQALVLKDKVRAIAATGRLIRGSRNSELLTHLADAGNRIDDPVIIFGLGLALAGVGGRRARHAAVELAQRLHPADRIGLEWFALKLTPIRVIERMKVVGMAPAEEPDPAAEEEGSSAHVDEMAESNRIFNLAEILDRLNQAELILWFPTASATEPPANDELFIKMIRMTRGKISVSGVSQVMPPAQAGGAGTLRFIMGSKPRTLPLEFEPGHFAAERLVFGVNQLCRSISIKHRLIPLLAPQGTMGVIFGDPQRTLLLLKELRIPIDFDLVKLWRRDGVISSDPDQAKDSATDSEA